jgi:hypothetical protein
VEILRCDWSYYELWLRGELPTEPDGLGICRLAKKSSGMSRFSELFLPKSDERLDPCRATRRDVRGESSDCSEEC